MSARSPLHLNNRRRRAAAPCADAAARRKTDGRHTLPRRMCCIHITVRAILRARRRMGLRHGAIGAMTVGTDRLAARAPFWWVGIVRILVTGSSGLVGVPLVAALQGHGHEVVCCDLRDGGGTDIRDGDAMARALAGCDGIVHLAAVSRVAWGEAAPALCDEVNVAGTATVIEAALAAPRRPWMVFASSREVYGTLHSLPATEDAPLFPQNIYGRSKLAGEELVRAATARGLRAAIVRLSNVYGGMNDHPDRAVPALMWRAVRGLDLTVTGAETFFDFVHVHDSVAGLGAAVDRLAAGHDLPPVHLVTGRATTLRELAGLALSIAQAPSRLAVHPARPFDVPGFVGDPGLARRLLGWQAQVALEDGLRRLCDDLHSRGEPMPEVRMPPPFTARMAAAS